MDALDKLSHLCFWQAEQNRVQRNKFPGHNADPMYLVMLGDLKTGDTRRLFLNHGFPVRRVQGRCLMGSKFGFADTFRGMLSIAISRSPNAGKYDRLNG